jgi:HEAT repeat protein
MQSDQRLLPKSSRTLVTTGSAVAAAALANAAERPLVSDLLERIKSPDEKVSGLAWQDAHQFGPEAIGALAPLLEAPDLEVRRSAKRAMYQVLRHAGAPNAHRQQRTVEKQLLPLLKSSVSMVRREALWMLSEIGSEGAIPVIAALLSDPEVHDDARCVLLRFPGKKSTAALKKAFQSVPEEYKYALADSLRARGERVDGYPSRRLLPTGKTTVEPVAEKTNFSR